MCIRDRCSGSFTLLRSDEAALWAKPQGRTTKASLRGPIIWSRRDSDAATVEVPELGAYDLAIAWGESAGFDGKAATVCATPFSLAWAGMDDAGAKAAVEITEGVDIRSTGQVIFHIDLFSSDERPLSPIIAATHGLHPDASLLVKMCIRDRPDLVLPKYRAIVFVEGCFWHGHSCQKGRVPGTNPDFWQAKVAANQARDKRNQRVLRRDGWRVFRVWECQLAKGKTRDVTLARLVSRIST